MIATDISDAFALSALRSEHWDALRSQTDERLEFSSEPSSEYQRTL